MANTQIGPINTRIAARNKTDGNVAGTSPFATPANYASISALRTRLAAISGTTYTAAVLNTMTVNDMVYAIRLNDDAGTI
jgi:hypothetical protein